MRAIRPGQQWGEDVGSWQASPTPDWGVEGRLGAGSARGRGRGQYGPQLGRVAAAVLIIATCHSVPSIPSVWSFDFYIYSIDIIEFGSFVQVVDHIGKIRRCQIPQNFEIMIGNL